MGLALWDCVPRVCGGGGGCAGGGVPLRAVPALSWCGEVSLGGKHIIIYKPIYSGIGFTSAAKSRRASSSNSAAFLSLSVYIYTYIYIHKKKKNHKKIYIRIYIHI